MNRTNEYISLVNGIRKCKEYIDNRIDIDNKLNTEIKEIKKRKNRYENYKVENRLNKIEDMIEEYKNNNKNNNEIDSIIRKDICNRRIVEYTIKYTECVRNMNKMKIEEEKIYDNKEIVTQPISIMKKRVENDMINEQINELGELMCDISMHISAQGERLKRIDEVVKNTDTMVNRGIYEIERNWKRIKKRRMLILKVLIFWIIFIFIIKIFFLK